MHTREQLSSMIGEYMAGLAMPSEPALLYEPIRYSLECGGKRIRPLLLMMACDLFTDEVGHALPCAAAVEVYHNFTLLHDDIMDNAPVRRGKPAVHAKWDENTAILSGDAMLIYAYKLLENLPDGLQGRVLREFNRLAIGVCDGQRYDMDFEREQEVAVHRHMEMISLKTSVLLAGSTRIGAIAGGAAEADCEALYEFALQLGMAFQIQDDILDTYGTAGQLGKNTGGDIVEGKKTILAVNAMSLATPQQRSELAQLLADRSIDPQVKIGMVTGIYDRLGAREMADGQKEYHTALSLSALGRVGVDAGRTRPLRELAESLLNRTK